ncbi:MAG: Stp1/IreP family PP2C-type Ser/Thr phosphatase [Polaromonas sp.]
MMYEIFAQTDQGLVRKNNEDALAFDPKTGLCLLADGMGGYNAGEVASSMAVAFLSQALTAWLSQAGNRASGKDLRRTMETCINQVNHSIFSAGSSNPDQAGMGTTLVAGVFLETRLVLGHIGDSRCYRLRGGVLQQITKDHSLLQEQVDAGLMTAAQALMSPHRNLITRALGVEDAVAAEINDHRVEPGDLYLMCSDGLTDMVMDPVIEAILNVPGALAQKAAALIRVANDSGGRDNISVLLVQASEDDSRRGLLSRMLGK